MVAWKDELRILRSLRLQQKKIPFRSFNVHNRNEETMGELFSFFILETILLGQLMKVNPFDQPSVELIKKETVKILR